MMKKLMEKCRMIRENQKKNGTKGFSMVELIIVIAIMAILVALIGTQLIPYLEKSRQSKDLNTLDTAKTALQSVIVDYELKPGATTNKTGKTIISTTSFTALSSLKTDFGADFKKYAGFEVDDASKFASNAAGNGQIQFKIASDGSITMQVGTLTVSSTGQSGVSS